MKFWKVLKDSETNPPFSCCLSLFWGFNDCSQTKEGRRDSLGRRRPFATCSLHHWQPRRLAITRDPEKMASSSKCPAQKFRDHVANLVACTGRSAPLFLESRSEEKHTHTTHTDQRKTHTHTTHTCIYIYIYIQHTHNTHTHKIYKHTHTHTTHTHTHKHTHTQTTPTHTHSHTTHPNTPGEDQKQDANKNEVEQTGEVSGVEKCCHCLCPRVVFFCCAFFFVFSLSATAD